jgi:uncharacterized protein
MLIKAMITAIGVAGVIALSSISQAASFDCAKASAFIEKKICQNPKLSLLDEQLGNLYNEVRGLVVDKNSLKNEQRTWLKQRRNVCFDDICRASSYEFRIDELKRKKHSILSKEKDSGKTTQKYRLKAHRDFESLYDNGVCHAILDVINEVPYEDIYQDAFLNILNGRENFHPVDWKLVEDGEKRFWPVIVEKTLVTEKPKNPEERIAALEKHKEKRGGLSYYLGKAVIYRDDKQMLYPILFFKANKLQVNHKRLHWDFIVLNDDLSGPDKKTYGSPGIFGITNATHIFKYKDLYFRFDSVMESSMAVLDFTEKEESVCGYELTK